MAKDEQEDLIDLPQLGHTEHTTFDAPVKVSTVQEDPVLALARDPNVDPDKLQKIIDMWNAQRERQAKERFDEEFALMQAEFEPVKREKQGHNYKYAPIEALQRLYGPIIHKHGFSYHWKEETQPEGIKRTLMTISGFGHSRTNSFDTPQLEGTSQMNAVQVAGAMSTYGRRYTFISGFGVTVEDEDTDGTFDEGVKYGQYIELVNQSKSLDELKANRKTVYDGLADDRRGKEILSAVIAKKAKELKE